MNNTIDRKKLASYNAILAILVVLLHTDNTALFASLSDGTLFSKIVLGFEWLISKNIASFAVPSFFMISGILFYRDFTINKYPKKLKSRFFSLIIPYLLWNLFRFLLLYALGKAGIIERYVGASRVLFTIQNFCEGLFFYKYNLGFWFMYQLILFTVLAPVIRLLIKNKWAGLVVIVSMIFLYASDILGEFLIVTLNRRFILLDCLVYYMIGAYIGTHFFDFVNKSNKNTKILAVLGIILGQALNFAFMKTSILLFYILFLILSAISLWYLYDLFKIKPLPAVLTSITFFIYAGHGTVLEFLQIAGGYLLPDSALVALLTYIAFPIVVLGVLVGVSVLLRKFVPKFWSVICGAR